MTRASQIKREEEICIWKYISTGNGRHEGRLERCNSGCDGKNTNCEFYINHGQIKINTDRN